MAEDVIWKGERQYNGLKRQTEEQNQPQFYVNETWPSGAKSADLVFEFY